MKRNIKKVAVIGSGIMGSGIACHFANIGVEVLLLDIAPNELTEAEQKKGLTLESKAVRNRLVNDHLANALKSKPSPIYHPSFASRITTGNTTDDMSKIATADWIIEVVVERLDIKKIVFEQVDKYRKPGTLVTSNTSGIPIQFMSEGRSEDFQQHFCGTHFFNPARYLKLFEIIPGPKTSNEVLDFLNGYGEKFLGKTSVVAKDTPAFIGNRIGIFGIQSLFHQVKEMGLTVEEVDKLTGPVIGRPKSATFRTVDVVGLDTLVHVANGIYEKVVFFPNWKATNDGFGTPANFTVHVDNVTSENGVTPPIAAPTTAAPTPPNRPAADVKSIFSNAYTPVAVLGYAGSDNDNTYDTSWCGATTTLVSIEGNDTNRITGLGCEGIAFLAGRFDAAGFTRLHIDIWTPTPTQDKSFNFKFSNWNGTTGETNAYEYSATNANVLTSGSEGTWIPIDIPFSALNCINTPPGNACPSVSDFAQFVITSDLGIVYYDNLYLHKNTLGVSSFETSNIKMYPNPATTNFTIEAQEAVEKVAVYNMLGQEVISQNTNSQQVTMDISTLQVGVYVVKATINGVVSTSRIIKE
mgnify:CR=1 FL=1